MDHRLNHSGLKLLFLTHLVYTVYAQTSVCTFTPLQSGAFTNVSITGTAKVNNAAVSGIFPTYAVSYADISYMGMTVTDDSVAPADPDIEVDFNVELYDTSTQPHQVNISLTLTLVSLSGGSLSSASMEIDLDSTVQAYWNTGIPAGATLSTRSQVQYTQASGLTVAGDSIVIHFVAEPTGDGGTDMPFGMSNITASVYYTSGGITYGVIHPYICVERDTYIEESIVYQHGFTALTFFIMFFVGIGLAILGVLLFLMIRRRRRDASVSPSKSDDRRLRDRGKKIVMDAKAAMRRGANAIKDFSLIAWNDSIVFILAMKDKLHMFREIDNLDILSTIHVDTDLETEQNDAAVQTSMLLVQGLRHNGDITKTTEDKVNSTLQNQLKDLDRKLEVDYKKDLESIYMDLETKNKEKLGDLLKKHQEQRQESVRVSKDLPEAEQKQLMELVDQQQMAEENELTYKLALEQNEEAEKLRKEYAIRKRMGIKEIQQHYIDDVVTTGQLNAQKADWLIKQHKQQQEEIHRMYDDEISRQRMNLEEKLARRKALAQTSETQEDDQTDLLNTIASLHLNLINKFKKSSNLSPEQIEEYMNQAKSDLGDVKAKLDRDRDLKQQEMFKQLSQGKRKSLAEKINQHASELQEYIKQNKALQAEGPVDPVSYVEGLVNLKSKQRKELTALENQIDEAHAKEHEAMKDQLVDNAKKELQAVERNLIEKLKSDGMQGDAIDKILKTHERNVQEMTQKQIANRKNQELKLKDELARRKRDWEERRAQEKKEQQDLRDHESTVVDKLLNSQVSISESERDRILKEHEKQMVKLENSLTLNKLRQKRMLEEKIAQKRAVLMEDLQQKQQAEVIKQRKAAEYNGEDDDEDTYRKELQLMKKHAEQKMALIQGQEMNIDEEIEEIRMEMTKERALALKDQEERLGALIASLQMDKAREMAKIEEQQKAINNLKANLMDDLNARGVLSTPECEKILDIHKQEQARLNSKLDGQRFKQEKLLRAKMQERLQIRENSMVQKQENEMKSLIEKSTNKTSAKIRRMLLLHKHLVEMEKFRNKLDREINQTLEDTKRNFEMQKQELEQEQELQFIAGLVKVGNFSKNELMDVLHMLFPGKTEEALTDMLNKIFDDKNRKDGDGSSHGPSTLADRIYTAQYSNPAPIHRRGSVMSATPKRLSKKGSKLSMTSRDDYSSHNQFGPQEDFARSSKRSNFRLQEETLKQRPGNQFDIGNDYQRLNNDDYSTRKSNNRRYDEDDDDEDDDYIGRGVGMTGSHQPSNVSGRLPPLRDQERPGGKKKKKRLLKKLVRNEEDSEDML